MKAVVITQTNDRDSVNRSNKIIADLKSNSPKLSVGIINACDPTLTSMERVMIRNNFPMHNFDNMWEREDVSMARFVSHYNAWKYCLGKKTNVLVLEDTVSIDKSFNVENYKFDKFLSLSYVDGVSYPKQRGPNKIFSNSQGWLKEPSAYLINPSGAFAFIKKANDKAGPIDLYLNEDNFNFIRENNPLPIRRAA